MLLRPDIVLVPSLSIMIGLRVPDLPLHRYARVALARWSASSSAGGAAASWEALAGERCCLEHDPHWGYLGRCHSACAGDLLAAARSEASAPWQSIAGTGGLPAWSISSSKGSLGDLQVPGRMLLGLPGMMGPRLAQELRVPSYVPCPVAAACASGLYGLLAVADTIERGQCSHGLAGAIDCNLTPLVLAGFASLGVSCGEHRPQSLLCSPTAPCRGFAPAEGLAFAALASEGPWRLLAGLRISDGRTATRGEDPAVLAECLAVMWQQLPHPQAILCHATGTAAGDAYELAAVESGAWGALPRLVYKPWIGHSLGASGLVELAATCSSPLASFWQISLGFGGHVAVVALERTST
jgi:hypothetical protein